MSTPEDQLPAPFTDEQLDEMVTEYVGALVAQHTEVDAAPAKPSWLPTTVASAEWSAKRVREMTAARDALLAEVAAYEAEVKAWATHMRTHGPAASYAGSIAFLTAGLEQYALIAREASPRGKDGKPKLKSIDLPSGRIQTTGYEPKSSLVIDDDTALTVWAEEHMPDCCIVSLRTPVLKASVAPLEEGSSEVVNDDGVKVPFCHYEWSEPRTTARVELA